MPDSESDPSPLDRAIDEYGREELEILCDLLSELALEDLREGIVEYTTDDLVKLITALSQYLQGRQNLYHLLQAIKETPIEEEDPEFIRTNAKITRRRNQRLKEKLETKKTKIEDLRDKLKAYYHKSELHKQLAARWKQELEEVRSEEPSDTPPTPEQLARAVASGQLQPRGDRWESGDRLLGALQTWADEHFGSDIPTSKSTIRRRMIDENLLAQSNGRIDVQETVQRCKDAAS